MFAKFVRALAIGIAIGLAIGAPTLAQAPGVYLFETIVTDTNPPAFNSKSLSNTNYFTVTVTTPIPPLAFTQPAQAVTGSSAQFIYFEF